MEDILYSGLYQLQNQTSQTGFQQGAVNFSASGTNGINQQQNQFGQFMQAQPNNFSGSVNTGGNATVRILVIISLFGDNYDLYSQIY